MNVISAIIKRTTEQKDCAVVIETSNGVQVTMYGEIVNGSVVRESIGASFWNAKVFNSLSDLEKTEVIEAAYNALSKLE